MFADDYLASGHSQFDPHFVEVIDERISVATITHVENVTNNFYRTHEKDDVWKLSDLGCIMPPYHVLFATTNRPTGTWFGLYPPDLFPRRWGVLLLPGKVKPPCSVVGLIVAEMSPGNFLPNLGGFEIDLDENGCATRDGLDIRFPRAFAKIGGVNIDDMDVWVQCMTFPVLYAVSLMHCRNITTVLHEPSRELNAKRQRSGKAPLLKYRTITIDPSKTPGYRPGAGLGTGEGVAWHKCRGHKRTYGGENGLLFGKYACSVWIPNHTKGSMSKGVVVKDYRVQPPAA